MGIAAAVAAKRQESFLKKLCKLGVLVDSISDPEDKDALEFAIQAARDELSKDPVERCFSATWLVGVLNDNGYSIGKTVVSDHLRGTCSCDVS
jgi:hypothetical protein